MTSMPLGGRSLHYAEQISHKFIPFGAGEWAVYADREATLNADLSSIEDRHLRHFRMIWSDVEVTLSRDHATWLRDALTAALKATKDEHELGH